MPLPTGGPWPPKAHEAPLAAMGVHSAWYAGDPDGLRAVYSNEPRVRPSQLAGGVVGAVSRFFWGAPAPFGTRQPKLHIPAAADICSTSADLLFSEPPTLRHPEGHTATQARVDRIVENGLDTTLLEAAEVGAALGGVYLKVTWDTALRDHAFLYPVHADAAVPEFRWGILTAVTFWRVLTDDGSIVVRHLERHEPGRILHGLYQGTSTDLGMPIPLTDDPVTAGLTVDADGSVETGTRRLTACYVPNMRPNRQHRGSDLGRSDLEQLEGALDALDETWTSWIRDIRLGKGRLLVPESFLTSLGTGAGAVFESDREVFVALDALAPARDGIDSQISAQQFAIRVQEHSDTCRALLEQIVRGAGYSAQTFGLTGEVAVTATEVTARERRSFVTRDKKKRYWLPELRSGIVVTLLAVDRFVFRSGADLVPLEVEFGDSVQEDPEAQGRTVGYLRAAEAASTDTLVRMLHPDWDDAQVTAEVTAIRGEVAPPLPDPDMFTDPPPDATDPAGG